MSTGRFVKRGRVYQGWAKRGWALAGSSVTSPVFGWVAKPVDRLSISSPQQRVWIVRSGNE